MKFFFLIFYFLLLINCSFDNKTGIWDNEINSSKNQNKNIFKDFETISVSEKPFKQTIILNKNAGLNISNIISNDRWTDIFYNYDNSLKNFSYKNQNQIVFKSKKLTKNIVNTHILYEKNNLIINDEKGNIIIYSISDEKIVSKFSFYKKKFKSIKKKLNLFAEGDIIYVADNLGYVYAYDYSLKKVIWAKNYKVPFSSNLKILNNIIIISNQINNLYFINKKNGDLIKQIPTEETFVKNEFKNNLSASNKKLFFLNTYGSLYSIDLINLNIDWFINLNRSIEITPTNLFFGNILVNNEKIVIASSKNNTSIIDLKTGSVIKQFNFSSYVRPLINNNLVFFLSKNNYLICYDIRINKIIYSYNLNQISPLKKINIENNHKEIMLLNNEIFIFLKNSYVLNFSVNGDFKNLKKLPSKIKSFPISIDETIIYLNHKNKLSIIN